MKQCIDSVCRYTVFTSSVLFVILACLNICNADAPRIEIPSSVNPVGSGARALGMGGAFIAVADDATAASWNPGGLIQLDFPEISVVGANFWREEENSFGKVSEANGSENLSESRLNYLSATWPFNIKGHPMVVSLNYQYLYDFTRKWDFGFNWEEADERYNVNYQQDGGLSALGLAYAAYVNRWFSCGFTLNFWDNDLGKNEWNQKAVIHRGNETVRKSTEYNRYSLKGFNMNFGFMLNYHKFNLGAVLKTPFDADLTHKYSLYSNNRLLGDKKTEETLKMPMSYGIGVAYRHSDELTIAADIYRTEWDDFIIDDGNEEKSAVTGKPLDKTDIDPTHQIRIGAEYIYTKWKYVLAFRGGAFYDPAPAEGSSDDFWGMSLGTGILFDRLFNDRGAIVLDIAYQYRFGDDVGKFILEDLDFSQDVEEHTVYSSVIIHF